MGDMNQNELIAAMTDKQLLGYKAQFKGNAKVEAYIDDILAGRVKVAEEAKVKAEFEAKIKGLANLPTPPAGILNVHLAWKQADDLTAKPEIVKLEGKADEARYPKVWQWVVSTNHAEQVARGAGGTTSNGVRKLAIHVDKRDGTSLTPVGNFRSGAEACKHLDIDQGAGSANMALLKAGYVYEAYNGQEFTVKVS